MLPRPEKPNQKMKDANSILALLILLLGCFMLTQMVTQGRRIIKPKPVMEIQDESERDWPTEGSSQPGENSSAAESD